MGIDDTIENDPRRNRNQSIEIRKPPIWFSPSTFSTLALSTRPASTSSRPLCPVPAPSSWTSSAPAASPSPPSSRTPRPSSSARAAPPSCASPPVARPVSPRAALSAGSKLVARATGFLLWVLTTSTVQSLGGHLRSATHEHHQHHERGRLG